MRFSNLGYGELLRVACSAAILCSCKFATPFNPIYPACSPAFFIVNQPSLSAHSCIFQTSHSCCFVLGLSHVLCLSQSGVPKAEDSSSSQSPTRAAVTLLCVIEKQMKDISKEAPGLAQLGTVLLQPPLVSPYQNFSFPS